MFVAQRPKQVKLFQFAPNRNKQRPQQPFFNRSPKTELQLGCKSLLCSCNSGLDVRKHPSITQGALEQQMCWEKTIIGRAIFFPRNAIGKSKFIVPRNN